MKRKLRAGGAVLLGLVLLFILAVPAAPLWARLGVKPMCIQGQWPKLKLVPCPEDVQTLPDLGFGQPQTIAAGARPLIIDTDMAPDDWMAILFLLQHPNIDVKAITVSGVGEAHCGPGVQNALNLAALAGRPEIPVACGRETPLQGQHTFPQSWRDYADTLAGLSLPASSQSPSPFPAAQLITRLLAEASQPLTIIALGPLTNLAEAFQASAELTARVQNIYVMGGAFQVHGNMAVSGAGIENAAAEWNIYIDPHAAALVLESGVPVVFVPLDATNQAPVSLDFYQRLAEDRRTPAAEFVFRLLTRQLDSIRGGRYFFWDPFTAAVCSDESLATFTEAPVSVVEEEGPLSGATRFRDTGNSARVSLTADRPRFEALFLDTLNGR